MRLLIRIFAVVAALLVVAVVALALTLPSLVGSEEVRARITEAARDATGRDFAYAELDVGVLPPRLVVTEARLSGAAPEADPTVEGANLQLRLSLMPLLARSVVVDSLVLEGATLRLVRTKDGIELPQPEEAAAEAEPGEAAAEDEAAMALAVRRVSLRKLRLVLEDRAVSPPVTWDLGDLEAEVEGSALDAPLDVRAAAKLASGGALSVQGTVTAGGPLDLETRLDALDLTPLAPYLGEGRKVGGLLSGSVRVRGESTSNPGVVLDLKLADADVAVDEIALRGAASIAADLTQIEAPAGSFEIDATQADLRYGEGFQKPAGTSATLQGRIQAAEDGSLVFEETKLRLKNFDGRVRVETGTPTRLRLDAPAFELEGWEALLPALADTAPRGRLAFEGLDVVPEPLAVRGRIVLDDLRIPQASGPELTLRGAIRGEGSSLVGEDLEAVVAGQTAEVDLRVTDLARKRKVALRTTLDQADSNALVAAFTGKRDALSGPLDLDADLALPLGGDLAPVKALSGTIRFGIEPGRLTGVSLLRSAVERLGALGGALSLAGAASGKDLQKYYSDEFRLLGGTLRIARGIARTNDLRLVYKDYSVDLRGSVNLAEQTLDLTGSLTMDPELGEALAGGDGGRRKEPKVLPLAQVTGTFDEPRVVITRETAIAFGTRTGKVGKKREKLEEEVDDVLGEGAGKQVFDALEGFLGGRKKR